MKQQNFRLITFDQKCLWLINSNKHEKNAMTYDIS